MMVFAFGATIHNETASIGDILGMATRTKLLFPFNEYG